ncbi:MAG TPA: TetR/AcrR family transcriptional regulator [Polyangiaceae bacterium]|nr:TetR/AcrR family transcriptional regulator [Polyangiaceae bacterium]
MAATKATRRNKGAAGAAPDPVRERILDAFSAKAKNAGIRGIMMAELATELRMSAATLYKRFPSKEALAMACVDRWIDELGAAEAAKRDPKAPRGGFDQFMHWIDGWADAIASLSPVFFHDLENDYPVVWRRYCEAVGERKSRGAALLRPLVKTGLDKEIALAVLDLILTTVLLPEFADRLHVSRHDAIRVAVSIWAGGALERGGNLKAIRGGRDG